jgi:hypothetical protein
MRYKLLALDLDGTLLREDKTISERSKVAIAECHRQGIEVVIATGRMYISALPYARELELTLPIIAYQGALIREIEGRVVSHLPMTKQETLAVLEHLKKYELHINVYIGDRLLMDRESERGKEYAKMIGVVIEYTHFPGGVEEEVTKITVIGKPETIDQAVAEMDRELAAKLNMTRTLNNFLEISDAKATKATALDTLGEMLGIKREEIMAFGDSPNDADMIAYAGCGVAMGNAHPSIKEASDFITLDNERDGVARVIEKLLLDN